MQPFPLRSLVSLASAQLLLGTLGIFVLESGLDPLSVVFYRCLIGALALGGYCWARGWLRDLPSRRTLLLAGLSGLLMVGNWILFFAALERIGIAVATIVFHVQPFLVVLLGALVFGERLALGQLAWIGVAFLGLLAATDLGEGGASPVGILFTLGGAFLYAWVTLLAKRLGPMKPHLLTFVQCAVGIPLLAAFGPAAPGSLTAGQGGWLLGLGLIHTGLVYVMIYGALPKLPTPVIAVLLFVYPASAVVCDALVYGRLVSPLQMAGLLLIVGASLGLALRARFRQ